MYLIQIEFHEKSQSLGVLKCKRGCNLCKHVVQWDAVNKKSNVSAISYYIDIRLILSLTVYCLAGCFFFFLEVLLFSVPSKKKKKRFCCLVCSHCAYSVSAVSLTFYFTQYRLNVVSAPYIKQLMRSFKLKKALKF